LFISQLEL